ncbi:MAG: fumarylacetoacetase [Rhodothermales bacterium]|nr:fumarylacetoacetase [Rhodothermales bacterium]
MPDSWLPIAADSDFSVHNLPFGIFSAPGRPRRTGVAIGDWIIDLAAGEARGLFAGLGVDREVFLSASLNRFIALGKATTSAVRTRLAAALVDPGSPLRDSQALVPHARATIHLPVAIGDYTDFYSSIDHATHVGTMFRDPANALLPNWRHLPVGYHGRASSIVVSGTPIRRPAGQVLPKGEATPVFTATSRLDFELEIAFVIGKDSTLGEPIPVGQAEDYIFGLVLFNDWSARDIQQWEYVPLGPFLAKNFASSISPWIVPIEALEPFRVVGQPQEPAVLPYLATTGARHLDIALEVGLVPASGDETIVSRSNARHLYWSMTQQLAHHTVNGCNVRVGDLMASGTISGPDAGSYGSLLELSWAGSRPVPLRGGGTRTFLEDGDTVTLRGHATRGDIRVGFGEVRGQVQPANHPLLKMK